MTYDYNKKILIFLLFLTIASTNISLADEAADLLSNFKNRNIEVNYSFLTAPNAAVLTGNEPINANLTGIELKLSFPSKNRFKYSLGTGVFSEGWGRHNASFFGGTNDEAYNLFLNNYFLELLYVLDLRSAASLIEYDLGVRIDYLNIRKTGSKIYGQSPYIDSYSSFSGTGYMVTFPLTVKKYFWNLLLSFSYAPGFINVPVAGNIDGTPSSSHFNGGVSNFLIGISYIL
ncbi:MAG: hypothetical protein WC624_00325 [Candidatus Margulisiibacteriota bacterium]